MSEAKVALICQKICLYDKQTNKILLCKRQGEEDYDGVFSFPGGKMDDSDENMLSGIERELREELGGNVEYDLIIDISVNKEFTRKDGKYMILPHYLAIYLRGEIIINTDEYSEFIWLNLTEIDSVNHISNVKEISEQLIHLYNIDN